MNTTTELHPCDDATYNSMPLHQGDKVIVKAVTLEESVFGDTLLPVIDERYNSSANTPECNALRRKLASIENPRYVFIRGEVTAVNEDGDVTIKYDTDWLSKINKHWFAPKLYKNETTCEVSFVCVLMWFNNGLWRITSESPSSPPILPTRIGVVKEEPRINYHVDKERETIYNKTFTVKSEKSTRMILPDGDVVHECVSGKVEVTLYKSKKDGFVFLSISGRIFDWGGQCQKVMARYIHSDKMTEILKIWNRWHDNNTFAGCEHQHEYEFSDNPEKFVGQVCPICGHEFGSKWMREELPQEVIDKVKSW